MKKIVVFLIVVSLLLVSCESQKKYHVTCYSAGIETYSGDVFHKLGGYVEVETDKEVAFDSRNCVFVEIK